MQKKPIFLSLLIPILAISLSILSGCKRGQAPSKSQSAATAAQQMEAPMLAPPRGEGPPSGEKAAKAEGPAIQTGPLSLSPPPAPLPPPAPPPAPALPPQPLPAAALPPEAALPPLPVPQAAPPETKAIAAPSVAQPVPFAPALVKAETNIEIILDASGSQAAPFGGVSKFDLQKTAVQDVILQLKQTEFPRNIGIRVFGTQKPIDQHDCADTVKVYPIGSPDLDAIQKAISPLTAQGESPIAAALEAASKDFPAAANLDQLIILLADGSDTCGVDPCQTARALHMGNPKLIINVVGFDVSQEDADKLQCIATNSEGKFYLARNENELRKSLDEAVNSTIPYNLRLSTVAGATPIPTTITILKGGTEQVIKTETSFGTKLLRLPPGTYDILVEYTSSPEVKKPSKIIKGVDVLEKTRVEQDVNFDLGSITLSSIDNYGKLAPARYQITKAGTTEKIAEAESGVEAKTFFLTPGTYDISGDQKESEAEKITLTESGVEVKTGEAVERTFRFQKGTLALKGVTTQNVAIPFLFQIFKADQVVGSGAMGAEGGTLSVAPGAYDILFIGQDPVMSVNPRTKVTGAVVAAAETTEVIAKFEMGILKLSAVDGQGNPVLGEFTVRNMQTGEDYAVVKTVDPKVPVSVQISPGLYEVIAASTQQVIEPKPTVSVPNIEVTAATPVEQVIRFAFGTVKLRGRNAKEQPLETKFTIYRGGTEDVLASAPPSSDWLTFEISPGRYDVKAENLAAEGEEKPSLWIKDIDVEDGKQVAHEAIFTAGKLKIIGRGANNKIITCHFKVYQYGADTELINGDTGDDWQVFDIQPGSYYLEAGFVDPVQSVLLKKWINVKVGENEILELVLRF